ncbi:MAG: DUF1501 domain-containing protein [Planctomycetaceae bacterium]|nr:DUF1501 domain-containing protein [Planctomycetaceae bacterium]
MNHRVCTGPLSRRSLLQVGALALGGLSLRDLLAAQSASGTRPSGTSVIMLYLHGGPSQLETYDLKPDAPTEYRSIYRPIATNVPGVDICERFPLQAGIADKFSLVRSLTHDVNIHSDGGIIVLTGKRPTVLDPTSGSKSEHPDYGSVASKVRGVGADAIPPYVAIPSRLYMTRPTYLGSHHAAMELGDPSRNDFRPPYLALAADSVSKCDDRRSLLAGLDRLRSDLDRTGQLNGADEFRSRAFELLTSTRLADAFKIDAEPSPLRDRYGRNLWGQSCLMARRLAEAGSAVINIYFDTPKSGQEFTNWDDHIGNAGRPGHFGTYMDVRLPYMDQALSALIEDIWQRDLQQQIMVVAVGEFGRTPKLSRNTGGVGRDHWPQAMSALVSGGGLRMGQVVGATNGKAEYPTERPYTPQDLLATIYRHLNINPEASFTDYSGRPVPILPSGKPIAELT